MALGKIFGKVTTTHFVFRAEEEVKKLDYVSLSHKNYGQVLCQVIEIENSEDGVNAKCVVIGFKDNEGKIRPIRIPFNVGDGVERATDDFIKSVILLKDPQKGAFLGKLEGKNIDVRIDLSTLLTKHVAILAKSGAGKSYTVGVLLEEILARKIPLIIIDPHGEYSSMRNPNDDEKDRLDEYGLKPKSFKNIREYGDQKINPELKPLKLSDTLTATEIVQLLPKTTGTQLGILYNALKHLEKVNFANLLLELEREENNAKWMLVNNIEYLNNLGLFSSTHVSYNEMISSGVCTIINLKGVPPDVQELVAYKILKDLFEQRKQNKVPPFFAVIEEAHNYCPERSFGETKSSKIIRTIASEGRKFGLGICVVSQRPARVDKSVLSQCSTQIILKVTNPNDLKAITSSVEGITPETEEEIKNLLIGNALLTGITDMPIFIKVRPRMTKHGGKAVDIIEKQEDGFFEKAEDFKSQEMLQIIKPKVSPDDIRLMSEEKIKAINTTLVPAYLFLCKEKDREFAVLMEMENGSIIVDVENFRTKRLPELEKLSPEEIKLLKFAYSKKSFSEEDAVKKGGGLESDKIIESLLKKSMLVKTPDKKYSLSEEYIFSQLSKNACEYMPEPENLSFNEKREKKIRLDSAKAMLSKFTEVTDQQECFVVRYEVIKKESKKQEASPEKKEEAVKSS